MMLNVHVHVSVKIWSVTNPAVNGNFSKSRLAINGVSPEMQIFTIITNYSIVLYTLKYSFTDSPSNKMYCIHTTYTIFLKYKE